MSKAFLKIKIKSLAAEAVIIRKEENKYRNYSKSKFNIVGDSLQEVMAEGNEKASNRNKARDIWLSLKSHRKFDVRNESRSALLAYGYIKSTPYAKMESKCYNPPDLKRIAQLVLKFDPDSRKSLGNITCAADQNTAMVKKLEEWSAPSE
jgi:hypothetical protein